MMNLFAGLRSQIKSLKERLKALDTSKKNQKEVKEVVEALNALEERYAKERAKRDEKRKAKEQAGPAEVDKESAVSGTVTTTVSPASPTAPGAATNTGTPQTDDAPSNAPDDASPSCALCGGLVFADYAGYQNHMAFTHASDVMPTTPGQKEDKLVASIETESAPSCAICGVTFKSFPEYQAHRSETHGQHDYTPMDPAKKKEVVKDVEKKLGPAIIGEKEAEGPQFKLDDVVKPVRGSESTGKVMRWDGKPSDLVFVAWESGPLADRDGFGGYYPKDLELFEEPVAVEADGEKPKGEPPHNAGPEHICPECKDWHEKHADLRSNYDALLADLKEERKLHYEQGNNAWVTRLDQKITDLEKSIGEKFPKEAACPTCGSKKEAVENTEKCWKCEGTGRRKEHSWDGCPGCNNNSGTCPECNGKGSLPKTAGAENAKDLTIMDHTPPRANSGPDSGGKDSHDEFQDEWAMPAGIEMESAKGAPMSLFNAETAQAVADRINTEVKAPYVNAGVASLGGPEHAAVMFTISADPKDQWSNGILENSRYGKFYLNNDGELEQHSGGFSKWKQPNNALRKGNVKSVDQLIQVLNSFLAKVNATPATPAPAAAAPKTSALSAPITEPTKISVFKKEFLATPVTGQKKFGGYDISQDGKKLFNIGSKDSQPMTKEQLEFCAQIELTRGLKQAKLVEKIAFLDEGTKVFIIATDKAGKRAKFASLDHGVRGWAPISKFAFLAKEGEMRKHKDHIDNTYGNNGKEILVDCPNGSGNMVWLPMGELLPIQAPPATPESLNEPECSTCHGKGRPERGSCPECGIYSSEARDKESAKDCPDCHGTFQGKEDEKCPTCGRFAVQKDALQTALPIATPNQRGYLGNPPPEKVASLNKTATVVHREDGWHVLSEKGKNLGGPYKTKGEAVKRLRQVEYFKHHGSLRPFSKKTAADVLTDPYQSLINHITDMRTRMDQVNERLQNAPAVKTASDEAAPEMDLAALFADLTQGVELIETKIGGDDIKPELHKSVEELENKLWELEEKLGLTPELSEHEKEEPEHKEVVEKAEEMDKEASEIYCKDPDCKRKATVRRPDGNWCEKHAPAMPEKKEAAGAIQETDETITTNDPNAIQNSFTPDPTAPATLKNVQPTDDDNLEVPVAMPTSPASPGQKWVFDTQFNKYVQMPDPDYRAS